MRLFQEARPSYYSIAVSLLRHELKQPVQNSSTLASVDQLRNQLGVNVAKIRSCKLRDLYLLFPSIYNNHAEVCRHQNKREGACEAHYQSV